jgi:hypothetical protein
MGSMIALLKQLFPGVTITSTTGGKHVAGSDHYAGRAIDFVPAGGMGRYSKAEVEKILRDAGVDIRRNAQGVEQFLAPVIRGIATISMWPGRAMHRRKKRPAARRKPLKMRCACKQSIKRASR